MKRFYCKICKKVRRARKFPTNITTPKADKVTDRIGICNSHSILTSRLIRTKNELEGYFDEVMK